MRPDSSLLELRDAVSHVALVKHKLRVLGHLLVVPLEVTLKMSVTEHRGA
jgi:hypothetical protein